MEKKTTDSKKTEKTTIVTEEATTIKGDNKSGSIQISNSVIARIVRLAALDVSGVVSIEQGGFELSGIFTKKDNSSGINVQEDENGDYMISIHVVLTFGIELAKAADQIQKIVSEQVFKMTNKKVAKVDVFIDDVIMEETDAEEAPVE